MLAGQENFTKPDPVSFTVEVPFPTALMLAPGLRWLRWWRFTVGSEKTVSERIF
jgi:hypothetical protein